EAQSAAAPGEVRRDEIPDGPPTIRRRAAPATTGDGSTIETAVPTLNRPAGRQIDGLLIAIDCSLGMTLRVKVGDGNVELHADDTSKIEFISYTASLSDSVGCGQLKTQLPVTVIYRAGGDPRFLGQPLRVEFTGKN